MIEALWIILTTILHASCQAAIVAFLIAGIQLTLGRRLSPNWRIALWSLVILRLLTPTLPASRLSLLNLLHFHTPIPLPTTSDLKPTITFGIITDIPTLPSHPSPTIPTPTPHPPDWRLLPIALWAFGSFVLLLRLAISQTILLHRLRSSRLAQDARILKLLADCQQSLRAPPIRCIEADWISAPALCGLFHPTLLLPTNFSNTLSDSDLRFILMHELIHARRRDLLLDRLIALTVAFHWFNPATWLAWRRIRTERELACDQAVLQSTAPAARLNYGQTLLTIAERLTTRPNSLTSIGVADRHCSMRRRLLAIVHPPQQWKSQNLIAALCIALVTFTAFTTAETNPTTSPSSQPTPTPNGMVIRSYDVSPLLQYVPSDDSALDFIPKDTPHDSAHRRITHPTTQQLAQDLITDIQSHIDSTSWTSASITESNDKLLITQTPADQDAIWQYLSSQLADRATQITVETRLLLLTPRIISRWKARHPTQPLTAQSLTFTKPDLDELVQLSQTDQHCTMITAPRLTLFNREHGYCIVETTTAYVRDLHPSTKPSNSNKRAFEPDIGLAENGIRIDVRPILSADQKYVTLELNDLISNLLSMKAVPWPKAPHGRTDLQIQVPTIRRDKLSVSVSLPNDGYFLSPTTETLEPAGSPDKSQTFAIVHMTMRTSDAPPATQTTAHSSSISTLTTPQP